LHENAEATQDSGNQVSTDKAPTTTRMNEHIFYPESSDAKEHHHQQQQQSSLMEGAVPKEDYVELHDELKAAEAEFEKKIHHHQQQQQSSSMEGAVPKEEYVELHDKSKAAEADFEKNIQREELIILADELKAAESDFQQFVQKEEYSKLNERLFSARENMPSYTEEFVRTEEMAKLESELDSAKETIVSYVENYVHKAEYAKLKGELESTKANLATLEKAKGDSVSIEDYRKVEDKLKSAQVTIELKEHMLKNSISIQEFDKLSQELETLRSIISAQDSAIKHSVSRKDYKKLAQELESAKSAVKSRDEIISNSVRIEDFEKVMQELQSAKSTIVTSNKVNNDSEEVYRNLLNELETAKSVIVDRDTALIEMTKQWDKAKANIASLKSQCGAKEKSILNLRHELDRRDKTIERLEDRIQHLEDRSNVDCRVLEKSSMDAKINDAKKRQAALRKKFLSPHRIKKNIEKPGRDYDALALSPAGGKQRPNVLKETRGARPISKQQRNVATPKASSNPPSPQLQRSPGKNGMLSTESRQVNIANKTLEQLPRLLNNGSQDDDAVAKEVILNLFDSWSTKQFAAMADSSQPNTPPSAQNPQGSEKIVRKHQSPNSAKRMEAKKAVAARELSKNGEVDKVPF
jgi:5-bromo-4-chloroindolyl phosphate hydrolysis protein